MSGEPPSGKGRIAALVGLSLLEVIRTRDLPTERLGLENPAETMPRRLGLSGAVDLQIRRFRAEEKRRGRITDDEAKALFSLVLRRPDAEEVFLQAGELMAGKDAQVRGVGGWSPARLRFALARRQFRKRSQLLFGRSIGGFAHGPFALEASGHLLLDMDPGGSACSALSGLAQTVISRYCPHPVRVSHVSCVGKGQEICRWAMSAEPPGVPAAG